MRANVPLLLHLFAIISLAVSCGHKEKSSNLKHLTPQMPTCDIDDDVTTEIWNRIDGKFSGNRDLAFQYAQQLSVLPTTFREFIVGRVERGEMALYFTGTSRQEWIGETFGGFDGTYPVRQGFQPNSFAVTTSALHEIGHALSYYSYQMQGRGDEIGDIERGFQNALYTEANNIWSYAKSSRYEWFASAFSHFMCSKDAREEILPNYYPSSFSFMNSLYANILIDSKVTRAKTIRQITNDGNVMLYVYLDVPVKSIELQNDGQWLSVDRVFNPQPEFTFIRGIVLPETLTQAREVTIRYANSAGDLTTKTFKVEDK